MIQKVKDGKAKDRSGRKAAVTTWRRTPQIELDHSAAHNAKQKAEQNNTAKHKARRGAKKRETGSSAQHWKIIFALHRQVAGEALSRIMVTPIASLMTILVLGITLALPATLSMTLENLQAAAGGTSSVVRLALYLDEGLSNTKALDLKKDLQGDPAINKVTYISPKQGLAEFEKFSGLGQALDLLDDNPLPGVLEVEPKDTTPLAVSNLQNRLGRLGEVNDIRVDNEWLKRLHAMLELGERALNGLTTLVVLSVLLAVGNTIRLLVVNRKEEIKVVKLVGGSDSFVMMPFLYSGFWYGLLGGVLAWLVTACLWFMLADSANSLASLYQSSFQMSFPDFATTVTVIFGSVLLGVTGAFFTSWRQLRAIDP
ncbi:permease-like cell division protein FtsX [Sansalvadorimonas sp. 2012CJ34-2]|uniref:Cell division protein FtsX n=1 Tax=Parendozoicomonas callyspongiae TaxID=2942213 RepID=A0ABT0PHK6_9GAMM|nr:permease-like cell division protein FtsX [Sansalvadorimonas sp. 2012CJ34-2]MCL6270849.1 permease-like cell division protein FtsX [Sansalvadorimonas sp. 2012CJ34-2]